MPTTLYEIAALPERLKLALLAATVALAASARLRVLPRFDAARLLQMAWHIAGVTLASVLFVVFGVGFRCGWLS